VEVSSNAGKSRDPWQVAADQGQEVMTITFAGAPRLLVHLSCSRKLYAYSCTPAPNTRNAQLSLTAHFGRNSTPGLSSSDGGAAAREVQLCHTDVALGVELPLHSALRQSGAFDG